MAKSKANGHAPRALKQFKTYKFRQYDPAMEEVLEMIAEHGVKISTVSDDSGVSQSTLHNWKRRDGKRTRRPQNATVEAAGRALGKKRVWVDM